MAVTVKAEYVNILSFYFIFSIEKAEYHAITSFYLKISGGKAGFANIVISGRANRRRLYRVVNGYTIVNNI